MVSKKEFFLLGLVRSAHKAVLYALPLVFAHGKKYLFVELLCFEACLRLHFVYATGRSFNRFDEQRTVRFFLETTQVRAYSQLICSLVITKLI